MEYARHDAAMRQRTDDGVEMRAYLEASAARGNVDARRRLEAPEFPEHLEYLWGWIVELHGRSGVGMGGINPLTYETIMAWSELTGQTPDALEVQALMQLDAALRVPEKDESKADADPKPKPPINWPEKKHG